MTTELSSDALSAPGAPSDLGALVDRARQDYEELAGRGLSLDLTRGSRRPRSSISPRTC